MRAQLRRARHARLLAKIRRLPGWRHALVLACGSAVALATACGPEGPTATTTVSRFRGETMGTTYSVIALGLTRDSAAAAAIDSLLVALNQEVSTYIPSSLISTFNRGDTVELPVVGAGAATVHRLHSAPGAHFAANLSLAAGPVALTGGYFDPTVGPLVDYYGFGSAPRDTTAIDTAEVRRLLGLVGMGHLGADTLPGGERLRLYAKTPGVRLDLSAIAKGYGVDQVFYLLRDGFGATDLFVEIGGEARAIGRSPRGDAWSVGINTPDPEASLRDMALAIDLVDYAIATSGNYRNRRNRGGVALVHTIDPHTGAPRQSTLLSASVLARDCATADAYATACMASGEGAVEVLAKAGLSACLIFGTADGNYRINYVGDFTRYVQQITDR